MPLLPASHEGAIPLHILPQDGLAAWLEAQHDPVRAWVGAMGFKASLGETLVVPGADGRPILAVFGWGTFEARARDRFHLATAVGKLPAGAYRLTGTEAPDVDLPTEALGWLMAGYRFGRYKAVPARAVDLVCPNGVDAGRVERMAAAAALAQDLINTPARDMGPEALEVAFLALAAKHGATTEVIRGRAELRTRNFPMIEAVGAAADQAPRLLDLRWGHEDAPKVTIVGKGVCFDTGGLDIKPPAGMLLMKKDMGGAATAMGLADMVMGEGLPVRLRLLVPAVENAISAPAMRPGDILTSRKGLTVEVNNTDAEGRLVLADALAYAEEESPDLLVSFATLTGAARVALGPDVPPFYTDDEKLAEILALSARHESDPLWRMPFWNPYEALIEPGIADLDNAPGGGMAGSITAALFLRRFVRPASPYIHLDIYGWTPAAKPARPKGGAFQGARALFGLISVAPWLT